MSVEIDRDFKERLEMQPITIGVLGNIGVGKSTLARRISDTLGIEHVEEKFVQNPFLEDFYRDQVRWSFDSEFKALLDKLAQLKNRDQTRSAVIDPGLEMDFVYAMTHVKMGWMDPKELNVLYEGTAVVLKELYKIKEPDIILRLHAQLPVILERIQKRDRPMERGLLVPPYTYLRALESSIDEYVAKDSSGKIMYLDVSNDNYIDDIHVSGILEMIKRKI